MLLAQHGGGERVKELHGGALRVIHDQSKSVIRGGQLPSHSFGMGHKKIEHATSGSQMSGRPVRAVNCLTLHAATKSGRPLCTQSWNGADKFWFKRRTTSPNAEGQRARFTLLTQSGNASLERGAAAIRDALAAIGLQVVQWSGSRGPVSSRIVPIVTHAVTHGRLTR